MTLVMSLVHAPLAFHEGDRLITEPDKGRRKKWDPLTNKSVLVLAQNGYMCVSYSGLAYIDGKPTDQWLAEAASGRQTISGVAGGPATLYSTTLMPRIGPALSRIRTAIETDFASQPLQYRLTLLCWNRERCRSGPRQPAADVEHSRRWRRGKCISVPRPQQTTVRS
jgi:hypothetical protein